MSLNEYKFSCELLGHSQDVRGVAEGRNCVVSVSRDKTAKIWSNEGNGYTESMTLKDHTNFVSSVCVLENGEWICTGSNDNTICVYTLGNAVPFTILRGHKGTVCALAPGLAPRTLISGSWDTSARVWKLANFGDTPAISLDGHEAAVWAVSTLGTDKYVTGSADKNIFVWNTQGQKVKVMKGHTDCVRGLIGFPDGSLISCGNDACIRYWNADGECIKELFGHSNYIYSISLNPSLGSDIVVTGSEDSTIRMWSMAGGQLGDAVTIPAQSVWSVACLKNGDIVTGSSDGIVRIFTKDSSRMASAELLKVYQQCVDTRIAEQNLEIGGFKVNELPGPESLLVDGTEGQTKIVRQPDGKMMCYKWENGKWDLIGDVTGATGGTQATSGKQLYEGKEYDYVFNVDISSDSPAIKLPYNRGEDPWHSAQKFIHANNLPQVYLDQVANFIIKNSDGGAPVGTQSVGYQDPFTGGSRYIPGSNDGGFNGAGNNGANVDPFTGASSYSTTKKATTLATGGKHFPYCKFTVMDACDLDKVLNKLREFNPKNEDVNSQVSEQLLDGVIKLASTVPVVDSLSVATLKLLMNWPSNLLFPVLDIVRLSVRHEAVCSQLGSLEFLSVLIQNIGSDLPANQLMAIRSLANMMVHGWGRGLIEAKIEEIVLALACVRSGSANLQIAHATLLLNASITQTEMADHEKCRIITEGVIDLLKWSNDLEALYRSIQALGNLMCTPYGQTTSAQIVSVDSVIEKIRDNMSVIQPAGFEKVTEAAQELIGTI